MVIAKREPGRPTLCTPEVVRILVSKVRAGVPITRAAEAAGISKGTWFTWVQRGEAGEEPFADFLHQATQARSALLAELAEGVTQTALTSEDANVKLRAQTWILERADKQNWSRAPEVVVEQAAKVQTIDASVTVEQLEAQLEEMSET